MKLVQRALGVVAALGLLAAGLLVAWIILAIAFAAGLALWGYIWWKSRKVRRHLRARQGSVIEGEFSVEAQPALPRGTAPHERE